MNLVSLLTFLAGVFYIGLGSFGLRFDYRARLNQIFFLLCLACAWWAFCIAFMFPAADRSTAWFLLRLSSPGWCMGPPLILHFTIYLTSNQPSIRKRLLTIGIYLLGLIFTIIGLTRGLTSNMLVLKSFGWDNLPASNTSEYWAYVVFYLFCVGLSIGMLIYWGNRSHSQREKEQARILAIFSFLGLLLASGSETLLPLLGIKSYPKIPVVMWLLWAYGMWYAISKYRFLSLTPEIASQKIIASITDMMIMLNPQGQITIANQSVQKSLAYASGELLQQPASCILADKHSLADTLTKIHSGLVSADIIELDYQSKHGEKIPVRLSCSAIRDRFEELVGVVLVAQDLRPTRLLETQNEELEAMTNDLLETNLILEKKSRQIKNILDHVGQGFLAFGPDLLIKDEYSQECQQIFSRSPARQTLAEMLYPGDDEQAAFFSKIFSYLLGPTGNDKADLYLPLLPAELELNQRCISLEYQLVNETSASDSKYVICILTDITEKRLLQEKMEEERSSLKMVVKAIVYYDTFIECIEDFRNFSRRKAYEIINSPDSLSQKIAELNRCIHTFKGNFSQFDTSQIVKKLHQAESMLSQAWDSGQLVDDSSLRELFRTFHIHEWLDDDLGKISDFLGEDFLRNKETYKIEKEKLLELEEKMALFLPPNEYALLLPYIRKLRYKPFKEMLKSYPEYVLQLAERMGKNINPFQIEGDNPLVDHEYYHFFARSLVHVFRNMVDHGIEYADERLLLGKSEIGSISCRIDSSHGRIRVSISDDGAGIDVEGIKSKAIASRLYTEAELASYTEEELLDFIFADAFSTADHVSLISGRGIGLSVVKSETERIHGSLQVKTEAGKGTVYVFDLPIPVTYETPLLSMPNILISIVGTVQEMARQLFDIRFGKEVNIISADKVHLHQYTALITIRGVIDGMILMSYNEKLLKVFARELLRDDPSPEFSSDILEDLTAEATNIILGNSLKKLGEFEDLVRIGVPTVTTNQTASIRQANTKIYTCSVENHEYMLTCSFIPIS